MREYILYKHPIEIETLYIVQYLYSINIDIRPKFCIERNHPNWVILPSIQTTEGEKYIGIKECIYFYEKYSNINDLLYKSMLHKELNQYYRINN